MQPTQPQGGNVGLTPVGNVPVAPSGPTTSPLSPMPSQPAGTGTPPESGSTPMPRPAPKPKDYMPPKSGSLKRAEILSMLYKHGVGIVKDSGCSKKKKKSKKAELLKRAKKVLVTASKKVPNKTKKQVAKALDKNVPGFKPKCGAVEKFAALLKRR